MAQRTVRPEILRPGAGSADAVRPRMGGAGGLFRDENLDLLSRALDTWFRIPGTQIRFGLDGIVGFIPGFGDLAGGLASCVIVLAAYFRGAPLVTVARMVANVGIEVVVGMVPILGNLFDIGWRANRRNYHLLERTLLTGKRDTGKDWLFMGLLGSGLIALALIPLVLLTWLLHELFGSKARWF
ncbi:MAG: DUF4112 domain-containing protein [Acidobacteriaceae bacterium]